MFKVYFISFIISMLMKFKHLIMWQITKVSLYFSQMYNHDYLTVIIIIGL